MSGLSPKHSAEFMQYIHYVLSACIVSLCSCQVLRRLGFHRRAAFLDERKKGLQKGTLAPDAAVPKSVQVSVCVCLHIFLLAEVEATITLTIVRLHFMVVVRTSSAAGKTCQEKTI